MKPKLRFKGFDEEWDITRAQELGKCQSGVGFPEIEQNGKIGIPFFKVSDMNNIGNEFSMMNSNNYVTNEQIVKNSWKIMFPLPAIIFAKVGAALLLNRKRLVEMPFLIDNNMMAFKFANNVDKYYITYLFQNIDFASLSHIGALPSINASDINSLMFAHTHNRHEQNLIGEFLKSTDFCISETSKTIFRLRQIKTAAMTSMFPQRGEVAPRVRFKGLDEPWIVDFIGDLFDERSERRSNGEMLSVTMRNGVIKASENGKMDKSSEDKSHYKVVKVNDIPYNTMRMWQGACGCSDYDGIVSPAYTVLIPKNGVDPSFFAVMFKTQILLNEFKAYSQGLTSDNWNLKYSVISTIPIKHPSTLAEQQKIAEFFQNLDRQIECQSQILERLKRVKAACLDQMFV